MRLELINLISDQKSNFQATMIKPQITNTKPFKSQNGGKF